MKAKPAQGLLTYGPIKVDMPDALESSKLRCLQGCFSGTSSASQNVITIVRIFASGASRSQDLVIHIYLLLKLVIKRSKAN